VACVCVCVCEGRIHTPKDCHILDLNPCILLFSVVMSGCKQLVAQSCWAVQVTKAQALLKFILKGVKTFFCSVQNSGSYSTWVFDSCCSYLTAAYHLTGHSVASFFALTPTQLLIWYFRVLPYGCGVLYQTLNAPLFTLSPYLSVTLYPNYKYFFFAKSVYRTENTQWGQPGWLTHCLTHSVTSKIYAIDSFIWWFWTFSSQSLIP
jgi:hypothetical protein